MSGQAESSNSGTIKIPANSSGPSAASESSASKIFVNSGEPIKFFIQRDTGKQFIAWLTSTITKHGGHVVQVVPLSGYVLIDPSTDSGERLQKRWITPDRPTRHVICYTFVRASILAGDLIAPSEMEGVSAFFRDLSRPVEIYLHPSLDHELARKAAIDIEKYGGITETTEEACRVIVAPHSTKKEIVLWNDLIRRHDPNESKFIEDLDWVYRCIEEKKFEKTVHRKKNLGGRKPGAKRVEYTEQDDDNLTKYIAEKIPYAESGGRLGNNLYLELETNAASYPWAKRHSWHSWRNRYKTRQLIFDVAVRDYFNKHPPTANGEGGRPGHPALIPLENAEDMDNNDEEQEGNGSNDAGSARSAIPKKATKAKTRRQRRPQPRKIKKAARPSHTDGDGNDDAYTGSGDDFVADEQDSEDEDDQDRSPPRKKIRTRKRVVASEDSEEAGSH